MNHSHTHRSSAWGQTTELVRHGWRHFDSCNRCYKAAMPWLSPVALQAVKGHAIRTPLSTSIPFVAWSAAQLSRAELASVWHSATVSFIYKRKVSVLFDDDK